jgi:hypothetical protein
MAIQPAWRHPTAFAVAGALLLLPTFCLVVGSLLGYELGLTGLLGIVAPIQATAASIRAVDLFLVAAPALALAAAIAPLVRLGWERRDGTLQAVLAVRALALNLAIALVAVAVGSLLAWHIVVESLLEAGA